MTAEQLIIRLMKNVGVPWQSQRADGFDDGIHMGNNDTVITAAAGNSFIISHQPTFWSADDVASDLRDDPLFEHKMDFIDKNRLVVFRFHDHWHARRPDGITTGWNRQMGWDQYQSKEQRGLYVLPETTLGALAREMQSKLNLRSARMVGDPGLKVTRVASGGHYIAQCMAVAQNADVVLAGESREWETAEYIRDAVASGQKKGLIFLSHEGGEEAGMDECAQWLRPFVPLSSLRPAIHSGFRCKPDFAERTTS